MLCVLQYMSGKNGKGPLQLISYYNKIIDGKDDEFNRGSHRHYGKYAHVYHS
jgi:hypothetical protein